MKIKISDEFKIAYKHLKKRHRSLETDFESLLLSLQVDPYQGWKLSKGSEKYE